MQTSRRHWMPLAATALACLVPLSAAFADPVQPGDKIRFVDREGSTGGGEFGVRKVPDGSPTGDPSFDLFRTFCVQRTEFIDFSSAGFVIESITDHTVAGNDRIEPMTAYLYTKFRAETLPSYDFTPSTAGRVASANALQTVIWYLEQEPSFTNFSVVSGNPLAFTFYKRALDAVTTAATSYGDDSTDEWVGQDIGNVRVMNLTWATTRSGFTQGTYAQDQLVLVPTPQSLYAGIGLFGGLLLMGRGLNWRGVLR